MQKALMQMNVQLHHVIADITGATGIRIIDAIFSGVRDPGELAKLRSDRCKNDEETIALALQGNWREEHLFALKQAVELYRFYHQQIAQLDIRIESCLKTFDDRSGGQKAPPARRPKAGSNAPEFDVRKLILQMTGVDLAAIHGLNGYSAMQLISEIGLDMRRWPTEKHFASWLSLCPGNKKTGGRTISGRTRRNANRAAMVLRMAAQSVARSNCALGAYYRRMRARLGGPKAITATAHKLSKIVYNMLRYGKPYVDRGANYYEQQYRQRALKNLARRAAQLGFSLTAKAD
jgi:transposase